MKPLHSFIANDIAERLGEAYTVKALGFKSGKEANIQGRYINKKVDITICNNNIPIAGIAVKFVMQNYSQNSNNYFENMLGETANIRNRRIPYFQIFVILDQLPHYNRQREITGWEHFTGNYVTKYQKLSDDDIDNFFHTPNKTLLFVVHIPSNQTIKSLEEYRKYHHETTLSVNTSISSEMQWGRSVIVNDYEQFMDRVYHTILSL